MQIFKLTILARNLLVESYYLRRSDAQLSFDRAYDIYKNKPTYAIKMIEVHDTPTRL